MKTTLASVTVAVIMSIGCIAHGQGYQYRSNAARNIQFNGAQLSAQGANQLQRVEAHYRTRLPDGRYWYDRRSGAFGRWGGPTAGFIPAGLALGGRLPAHASGSRLPVYINGRSIHAQEYKFFTKLFGRSPIPGRYWLDHRGNLGRVGQPGSINLMKLAQRRGKATGRQGKKFSIYKPGIRGTHRGSIGVAGDGKTTCVNTANYTRCY